jgi:deazaflavin-dependent oxidoreductase (nitroreductase family)
MDIWIRALMAMNVFIHQLTRGRLGSKMAGQSVLLLHTVGRKSGAAYTTPINYYRDSEAYVVVASNWGKDSHPGWFYNLIYQGTATIQVKDQRIRIRARQASGEEYARLWSTVTSLNDYYVGYQKQTKRQIPVVVLTPE